MDRVSMISYICARWSGPIVVVLYKKLEKIGKLKLEPCTNISVQYLFMENDGEEYPVNKLRNIGINKVTTSHFLLIDIDFVPDNDL
jgi:hypothetical protein